LQNSKKDKNIY